MLIDKWSNTNLQGKANNNSLQPYQTTIGMRQERWGESTGKEKEEAPPDILNK